jgi:very-short-patch-repair endonuclease
MNPLRDWHYYKKEYVEDGRSPSDIANEWGTYPNMIRRELKKLGFTVRNHSEAQSALLKSGKVKHPTAGKHRTDEEKLKISNAMVESWADASKSEKDRRSEIAKRQWKNMSDEEKSVFRHKSSIALKESSKNGSILEKFLFENLREAGYTLQYHCKHVVEGSALHLDLFLPSLRLAIEIDGPAHSIDLWGDGTLEKIKGRDKKKNELLTMYDYIVIRLRHPLKDLSQYQKRKCLEVLLNKIKEIEQNPQEFAKQVVHLNIEGEAV